MKVYKIELMVLDFDEVGEKEIQSVIENNSYPNDCISPEVKKIESRDIGEWDDEHPLNIADESDAEYHRLFHNDPHVQRVHRIA